MLHYARAMLGRLVSSLAAVVPGGTYTRHETSPTDAVCNLTFNSSGAWTITDDSSSTGTWLTGTGTGANYWVRWTSGIGSLSTGTAGTWQQLNVSRTFGVTFTGLNGSQTATGTVHIATDAGGSNIIATGAFSLNAQVTP